MPSPFDFLNTINQTKNNLILEDSQNTKDYSAWMVNKGLSYFPDTIEHANAMNLLPGLPVDIQYRYLLESVRVRKRFSKWSKKKEDADVDIVMRHFNYSTQKAIQALEILTKEQVSEIKKMYKDL